MKYLMLLAVLMPNIFFAAPKSILIPFWDKSDESSIDTIDHSDFTKFLQKNLKQKGELAVFDYKAISTADKQFLANYIDKLQKTPVLSYNKKEQYAYWVNLYNAMTVKFILDYYPVKSIFNIPHKWIRRGPWDMKLMTVEGQEVSLNNIEHGILRPIWKDPRIHFIVNCASVGCPNIGSEAMTAQNSEVFMENSTRVFLNSARAVRKDGDTLYLSSLFDWYGVDFGSSEEDYIDYIKKYANQNTLQKLNYSRIRYEYDWDLNKL